MKSKSSIWTAVLGRRCLIARVVALGAAGTVGWPAAGNAQTAGEAQTYSGKVPWKVGAADAPQTSAGGFLTPAEREFIDAAVARLIPADDAGPGGREAGCTDFIDRQLAGPFGRAESLYMQGPWVQGSSTQGFQSRLTPAQSYRIAIAAVEGYCAKTHSGKSFAGLSALEQDELLAALESGSADLGGTDAKAFFEMLLQNTLEGFWSDPLYGGNRDFIGWNLIGFPGARYDYSDHIAKTGERFPLPPVGLKGRKEWVSRG